MTPIQALQFATALMFGLYGATALIGVRIFGGPRPAMWFASSNFLRMLALLVAVDGATQLVWRAISTMLAVFGLALLHRSFAEQLDRPKLLWRGQMVVVGLTALAVGLCVFLGWNGNALSVVGGVAVGVQAALTASALFSFSGEGLETAGRFAGTAMLFYALAFLFRSVVLLQHGAGGQGRAWDQTLLIGVFGALVSGAATTFGFGFIASGKQRVELLWRAQIDELTGLLNRWAFKRVAVRETFRCMRKGTQMSVLMMDLDGMKRVNDRFGHSCGDAVLQAVASRLQEALRERDSIARMGGDEFCVLLPDTDLSEAVLVAERLRAEVDTLDVRYRSETVRVRASFGVSSTAQCGWNWQQLVDESDGALYEAKRGGNLRVVSAHAAAAAEEMEVAADVAGPLMERRRGF